MEKPLEYYTQFMHDSCMAIKTISLELDAYEKLKAKKRPGESFSGVVRRAVFSDSPATGAELFQYFSTGGGDISEAYLNAVEENITHDPPPEDPWL